MNKYFVESDEQVDEALSLMDGDPILGADTETNGLDGYNCKLWSVQLEANDNGFLFPWNALNEVSRQKIIDFCKNKLIIAHNAKFDYKFLKLNGFDISECYCTQNSEKYLYQGKYFTFGLRDVLIRRFQVTLSKEERKDFYDGTFEQEVALYGDWGAWERRVDLQEYALNDIEYLREIRNQQLEETREVGMTNLLTMENKIITEVADMELRGVWLNKAETKKFESVVTLRRDILGQEIFSALEKSWRTYWNQEYTRRADLYNQWKVGHEKVVAETSKMRGVLVDGRMDMRKKTEDALKMVEESNKKKPFSKLPDPDNEFNPNSPLKLRPALSKLVEFEVPNTSKEWLEENVQLHPAIETLVEYRKFDKLSQFCQMTENIHPVTGRVHGRFNPAGTESGRFSSSDPNLQQIPVRSEEAKQFRGLFQAPQGKKFLQADYAGLEVAILAEASGEDILIDAINSGKDIHTFTMSLMFNCDYQSMVDLKKKGYSDDLEEEYERARKNVESLFTLPELEKLTDPQDWISKLRDYVKTLTYGVAYGLSEFGLKNKFHCSYEDAKIFIETFFKAYKNLDRFLKQQGELGYQRGYALNPFGRRRYFKKPKLKTYEQLEAEQIKELDKQKRLWDSVSEEEWEQIMLKAMDDAKKEVKSKINSIKRRSANFYPQSVNADMTKTAMFLFGKYFPSNDEEGLILTIHDELIVEVFDENVELGSQCLKKAMETAGAKFLTKVKIEVTVRVMEKWEK